MLPELIPYHLQVRDYFKKQPATWEFFAAARTREEQLALFQTELLKNTYQFRRDSDAALYEKIDKAREKLQLGDLPIMAYQAQYANDAELNASIVYLHQEAHLVFSGPILEKLNEQELLAVIAHELTHIRLFTLENGDLEVADRIITAIANSYNSGPSYYETARLFKLYTEIYCDRGAYTVLEDPGPVISGLLKIATGLSTVSVENYALQAEAIFSAQPDTQSATPTHPENFIRTRALSLWHEQREAATPAITRMIEGQPELDRLDIFAQQGLYDLSRLFLQAYLRPQWFQSPLIVGLARQYFPDLLPDKAAGRQREEATDEVERAGLQEGSQKVQERLLETITGAHASIREYFACVLLDFVLADPSLEEMPAGRAFEFAGEMQLTADYEAVYKKELKLSDKKWQQHKRSVQETYAGGPKD